MTMSLKHLEELLKILKDRHFPTSGGAGQGRGLHGYPRGPLGFVFGVGELGAAIHGYSVMAGVAGSAAAYVGAQIEPFAPFVQPHLSQILIATNVLTAFSAAMLFRHTRHLHKQHKKDRDQAAIILADLQKQIEKDTRRAAAGILLTTYEAECARCDFALFTTLATFLEEGTDRAHMLDRATLLVESNIRFVLNTFCTLIESTTGKKCATSAKIIVEWGSGEDQRAGAKVRTVFRDQTSQGERSRGDGRLFRIDENTATKRIFLEGATEYHCDDLVAAVARHEYENTREGWEKDYNATIVVPIPSMEEDLGVDCCGLLFADTLEGSFANPSCLALMKALRWRLGVMLGRLRKLRELQKPAPKSFWGRK
jgi:hypothetical protein